MSDPARVALRVGLVALIPIIGCARLAPRLLAPQRAHGLPTSVTASATELPPPRIFEGPREPEDDSIVDLFGNDVTDAVAKYKLDSEGTLYELHSPQTQLPRLGSPKS